MQPTRGGAGRPPSVAAGPGPVGSTCGNAPGRRWDPGGRQRDLFPLPHLHSPGPHVQPAAPRS
eukprot:5611131-Lingulodinium_polyedra.AAC.1